MDSRLIITFLVILFCSSIYGSNDWKDFGANDLYTKYDTSNCVFPFLYNGVYYKNCTTDGDNGNRPWCSITQNYTGLFTYCYDFWNPAIACSGPCTYIKPTSKYKQCTSPGINGNYTLLNCISEHIKKSGKPLYHPNTCNSSYSSMSKFHSKCAGPSDFAIPIPMTDDNKQLILDSHNGYRAAVPSRYMFKLYWDDTLADMAQTHANMCAFDHDQANNRLTLNYKWKNGQNMIFATGYVTALDDLFATMFDSEKERFVYGVGCNPDGTCTHYTQLMLSNMTRCGCAETHCLYPDRVERQVVCNYMQSQYTDNYMIPYVPSDTAAIDCPSTNDGGGLCDCGPKSCKFDQNEFINPSTCQCNVASSKRSVDENELNERAAEEESVVYAPSGNNIDTERRVKREMRVLQRIKHPSKRMRVVSNDGTEDEK